MRERTKTLVKSLELVAAPVVVAILIIVFTPLGDQLRDIMFPPSTAIEGVVVIKEMDNKPLPDVIVVLENNKFNDTTNDEGKFFFLNIPNGKLYTYNVTDEKNNLVYGPGEFYFPPEEKFWKLDPISVDNPSQKNESSNTTENLGTNAFVPSKTQADYQIGLMAEGTYIPKQLRQPGLESNTHNITALVDTNSETLSQIERVTYYLHPTFRPSIVSSYSSEDNFAISFTAWGQFEIKAKVYFKDNKEMDLSLPRYKWIIQ